MNVRKANAQDATAICKISSEDLGYECNTELVFERLTQLEYNLLYHETMVNVLGIAVSSDCRRSGVGRSLLEHAKNWAKELGKNVIRLNSGSTRKEAHAFYRVMGFDSEKEQICFNMHLL